ncbi:MAG: hypothetical protein ACK5V3_15355 [Bdellovibrionales bacterium]
MNDRAWGIEDISYMLFLSLYLSFQSLMAQEALQLSSQQKLNLKEWLNRGEVFLFIQEDCEACEEALIKASRCPVEIRSKISLVALESESWALKKSVSREVVKMAPQSFFQISRNESKKLGVKGTPTFLSQKENLMKSLNCNELAALIKEAHKF